MAVGSQQPKSLFTGWPKHSRERQLCRSGPVSDGPGQGWLGGCREYLHGQLGFLDAEASLVLGAHTRVISISRSRVERMLSLHQQLAAANTPTEKTVLQRQIDAADHEIDFLVYELYGLSEQEIRIIEAG
jgi:hypothetical protein